MPCAATLRSNTSCVARVNGVNGVPSPQTTGIHSHDARWRFTRIRAGQRSDSGLRPDRSIALSQVVTILGPVAIGS